uniref:AEBP2-like C-terminal SH3 domain-containing protein n=1 Tax=Callorhinchus milii TaxID=7868 RepID=A0A4W3J2U7_CALMI
MAMEAPLHQERILFTTAAGINARPASAPVQTWQITFVQYTWMDSVEGYLSVSGKAAKCTIRHPLVRVGCRDTCLHTVETSRLSVWLAGALLALHLKAGLLDHVPTHFSQQNSAKVSSQPKVKEESPSKAVMNKRRRLKNKRRRSLPRPHDFFDAQTMDAIRHRAICFNLSTHIESHGNGHSVVFHSTVIARRREDSGKVKVLLHWMPEDILPDVWVNENDRTQLKTQTVHLSKLPQDTALLLDPNIYRTMPHKRPKRR